MALPDIIRYFRDCYEEDNRRSTLWNIFQASVNLYHDRFLNETQADLKGLGCETWTGYKVAGMLLDLVVARDGRSCGVDLVGYPGAYESAFPLERYKMFHRAGLHIIPLSYTLWRTNRQRCLQAILDGLTNGDARS